MRFDELAWQGRGQQGIGCKEQHEQRSADPQKITPQREFENRLSRAHALTERISCSQRPAPALKPLRRDPGPLAAVRPDVDGMYCFRFDFRWPTAADAGA